MPKRFVCSALLAFALLASCARATTSAPTPEPTVAATDEATPTPEVQTIEVVVQDGEVAGGMKRVEVDVGSDVKIVVTSDVADEVHVHGYDETADVEAGGTVEITFTADIPGVFVVELEERKMHILELEVR